MEFRFWGIIRKFRIVPDRRGSGTRTKSDSALFAHTLAGRVPLSPSALTDPHTDSEINKTKLMKAKSTVGASVAGALVFRGGGAPTAPYIRH